MDLNFVLKRGIVVLKVCLMAPMGERNLRCCYSMV